MNGWRAFVGEWSDGNPYRTSQDLRGLPWIDARAALLHFAREFEDDDCEHCAAAARTSIAELTALRAGTGWSGSIDRDDLILIRESDAGTGGDDAAR